MNSYQTGFPITADFDCKIGKDNEIPRPGKVLPYMGKACVVASIEDIRWLGLEAIRVRVKLLPLPEKFYATMRFLDGSPMFEED